MIIAKSSRRKKQDRARTESRHAEYARKQAERRVDRLFELATDMALAPAALAALIMEEFAGSIGTGLIAHKRLQRGAEATSLAETAQLMLEACSRAGQPENIPLGVLAFVVVAAHASGDEAGEARYTATLMDLASGEGDNGPLKVAQDVIFWTHPDKATEVAERYLLGHPHDSAAYLFWMHASGKAEELALSERFGPGGPSWLLDPGDPSDARYARRLAQNFRQVRQADPGFQARFQHRAQFDTEIMRRKMMPPWQVKRLQRTERGAEDI